MRTVILLRRTADGPGGAERVFQRYLRALQSDAAHPCQVMPISQPSGIGPGWWRAIDYAHRANRTLALYPQAFSISLERGPHAMVYRAGDGVHRRYRQLVGGFSLNPWHIVAPMLEAESLRYARVVIANSHMVAAELRQYYPWVSPKVRVVHNGFDPARFAPPSTDENTRQKIRERLGLPQGVPLFLFAGSGWRRKGLQPALQICSLCRDIQPTLVVVGKGNPSQLQGHRAIYRGVVDNMTDYYRACDALILPTLYDPFANVVLEALACGTPVVTTATNGASEVIQHGTTGYITPHPSRDHAGAAAWLQTIVAHPPAASTIAATVAHLTVQAEIDAIKAIFNSISATPITPMV